MYGRVRGMLARLVFVLIRIAATCGLSERLISRLGQAFALLLRPLTEKRRD